MAPQGSTRGRRGTTGAGGDRIMTADGGGSRQGAAPAIFGAPTGPTTAPGCAQRAPASLVGTPLQGPAGSGGGAAGAPVHAPAGGSRRAPGAGRNGAARAGAGGPGDAYFVSGRTTHPDGGAPRRSGAGTVTVRRQPVPAGVCRHRGRNGDIFGSERESVHIDIRNRYISGRQNSTRVTIAARTPRGDQT